MTLYRGSPYDTTTLSGYRTMTNERKRDEESRKDTATADLPTQPSPEQPSEQQADGVRGGLNFTKIEYKN